MTTGNATARAWGVSNLDRCRPPRAASLVRRLLLMPYLHRKWDIQEASLGHAVVVHLGGVQMTWESFSNMLRVLCHLGSERHIASAKFLEAINTIEAIRQYQRPMQDVLWEFHATAFADRRDSALALAGRSSDFFNSSALAAATLPLAIN
jgi:hypothetical protein